MTPPHVRPNEDETMWKKIKDWFLSLPILVQNAIITLPLSVAIVAAMYLL